MMMWMRNERYHVRHAPGTSLDSSTSLSGTNSTYERLQNFLVHGMLSDDALRLCRPDGYSLHPGIFPHRSSSFQPYTVRPDVLSTCVYFCLLLSTCVFFCLLVSTSVYFGQILSTYTVRPGVLSISVYLCLL